MRTPISQNFTKRDIVAASNIMFISGQFETIIDMVCLLHPIRLRQVMVVKFFFSFFLLQNFYIVFYSGYVSICKDLQKTIVLSSGPFLQVFTFTIQCICNV